MKKKKITHALIIRSSWLELILSGSKTWEIRGTRTARRGRIGLIRSRSGRVFGSADLVDVVGPMSLAELKRHTGRHRVGATELARFVKQYGGRAFAWVLEEVAVFKEPIPYPAKRGQVIWARLKKG